MQKNKTPTLQKAEQLRRANNRADAELARVIREWEKKRTKAQTAAERAVLDERYGARCERVDRKGSKAYEKYWNYVHDSFTKEEINGAMKRSKNGFTGAGFLARLFAKNKKAKRTVAKAPVKKAPKKKTVKRTIKKAAPKKRK